MDNNPGKTLIALGIGLIIIVLVTAFLMVLPSIVDWLWNVLPHSPELMLMVFFLAGLLCVFAGLIMKDYYD